MRPNGRSDPTISQALHVINGDTLNKKLSAPDGTIALFIKLGLSDRRILEHMFLSAYSRYPSDAERQTLLGELEKRGQSKGAGRSPPGARRHGLGHAHQQGVPVQPTESSSHGRGCAPHSQIYSLAWRPDGAMIALGGYKGSPPRRSAARKPIATLSGHAGGRSRRRLLARRQAPRRGRRPARAQRRSQDLGRRAHKTSRPSPAIPTASMPSPSRPTDAARDRRATTS